MLDHLFLNFSWYTGELPILEPVLNLLRKLMNPPKYVSELPIFFSQVNLFLDYIFSDFSQCVCELPTFRKWSLLVFPRKVHELPRERMWTFYILIKWTSRWTIFFLNLSRDVRELPICWASELYLTEYFFWTSHDT